MTTPSKKKIIPIAIGPIQKKEQEKKLSELFTPEQDKIIRAIEFRNPEYMKSLDIRQIEIDPEQFIIDYLASDPGFASQIVQTEVERVLESENLYAKKKPPQEVRWIQPKDVPISNYYIQEEKDFVPGIVADKRNLRQIIKIQKPDYNKYEFSRKHKGISIKTIPIEQQNKQELKIAPRKQRLRSKNKKNLPLPLSQQNEEKITDAMNLINEFLPDDPKDKGNIDIYESQIGDVEKQYNQSQPSQIQEKTIQKEPVLLPVPVSELIQPSLIDIIKQKNKNPINPYEQIEEEFVVPQQEADYQYESNTEEDDQQDKFYSFEPTQQDDQQYKFDSFETERQQQDDQQQFRFASDKTEIPSFQKVLDLEQQQEDKNFDKIFKNLQNQPEYQNFLNQIQSEQKPSLMQAAIKKIKPNEIDLSTQIQNQLGPQIIQQLSGDVIPQKKTKKSSKISDKMRQNQELRENLRLQKLAQETQKLQSQLLKQQQTSAYQQQLQQQQLQFQPIYQPQNILQAVANKNTPSVITKTTPLSNATLGQYIDVNSREFQLQQQRAKLLAEQSVLEQEAQMQELINKTQNLKQKRKLDEFQSQIDLQIQQQKQQAQLDDLKRKQYLKDYQNLLFNNQIKGINENQYIQSRIQKENSGLSGLWNTYSGNLKSVIGFLNGNVLTPILANAAVAATVLGVGAGSAFIGRKYYRGDFDSDYELMERFMGKVEKIESPWRKKAIYGLILSLMGLTAFGGWTFRRTFYSIINDLSKSNVLPRESQNIVKGFLSTIKGVSEVTDQILNATEGINSKEDFERYDQRTFFTNNRVAGWIGSYFDTNWGTYEQLSLEQKQDIKARGSEKIESQGKKIAKLYEKTKESEIQQQALKQDQLQLDQQTLLKQIKDLNQKVEKLSRGSQKQKQDRQHVKAIENKQDHFSQNQGHLRGKVTVDEYINLDVPSEQQEDQKYVASTLESLMQKEQQTKLKRMIENKSSTYTPSFWNQMIQRLGIGQIEEVNPQFLAQQN